MKERLLGFLGVFLLATFCVQAQNPVVQQFTVGSGAAVSLDVTGGSTYGLRIEADAGNAGTVYIGNSDVSSSNYFASLQAGEALNLGFLSGLRIQTDNLYAIATVASQTIHVMSGVSGITDGGVVTFDSNSVLQVGGTVVSVSATPNIETTAYADGQLIGELLTFSNALRVSGGSGLLQAVQIVDKDDESAPLVVWICQANPTNSTFTDQAALNINDADIAECFPVPVATTDYKDTAANSVARISQLAEPIVVASGTDLYGVIESAGTPTYTTSSDLIVQLKILQD